MTDDRIPFHILDELMVHVDDPVQPVTVQIEARVVGHLDDERLREAVHSAMGAHPLARARLEPWTDTQVGYEWVIDREPQIDPFRALDGTDDDLDAVRADFYSRPISLFESPPLRVQLVRGSHDDTVMVSFHHSASDGIGAQRFLLSVLRIYGGLPDPKSGIELADARSMAVPDSAPGPSELLEMGKLQLSRLPRLASRTSTLSPDGATIRPGYGFTTSTLPAAPIVSAPLRKSVGATVNDVLITAAALAAARWIDSHDAEAARISVLMPMNARPADWSTEVVANLVTGDSVSVSVQDRESVQGCLGSVARWTEALKKQGTGPAMASLARVPHRGVRGRKAALQAASWMGGGLPTGSLILSNLGQVPQDWVGAGEVEVAALGFSPPTANSAVALGACGFGDELVVTIRHPWKLWSAEAASRYAEMLIEEIESISRL